MRSLRSITARETRTSGSRCRDGLIGSAYPVTVTMCGAFKMVTPSTGQARLVTGQDFQVGSTRSALATVEGVCGVSTPRATSGLSQYEICHPSDESEGMDVKKKRLIKKKSESDDSTISWGKG